MLTVWQAGGFPALAAGLASLGNLHPPQLILLRPVHYQDHQPLSGYASARYGSARQIECEISRQAGDHEQDDDRRL